jgi:hypothetical protein
MFASLLCAIAMPQNFHDLAKKIEPSHKPRLLIVGFYHFSNPKLDAVKTDLDDHLSEGRQAQIAELNRRLAKFKPTKIAVEAPFGDPTTNQSYRQWLEGKAELTVNETQQVGFRLAKELGHSQVFPVDYRQDMDFDPTMTLGSEALPDRLGMITSVFGEVQKVMDGLKDHTVLENLRILNDPEADRLGNGFYLRMLTIVKDDQHPGADLVAGWWKRNMIWLAHLTTAATDPDDRVLVLCGSGHASLLRSLLRDSIDFEVVDQMPYLK